VGNSYDLVSSTGGPAGVGAESVVLFQLSVKTGASHLNLVQDEIVQVTLTATVRVQYANAGQTSILSSEEFVEMRGFVGELAAVGVASSSVTHSFAASSSANNGETSSSQSSPVSGLGSGAFVGILVAASAFIVVVAAVAVVKVKRATPAVGESQMQLTTMSATAISTSAGESESVSIVDGMTMREVMAAYDGEETA
jgi:hypothetical protein